MLPLTVEATPVGNIESLRDIWIILKQKLNVGRVKTMIINSAVGTGEWVWFLFHGDESFTKPCHVNAGVNTEGCNRLSFSPLLFICDSLISSGNELMQLWKLSRARSQSPGGLYSFGAFDSALSPSWKGTRSLRGTRLHSFQGKAPFLAWYIYFHIDHSALDPKWSIENSKLSGGGEFYFWAFWVFLFVRD